MIPDAFAVSGRVALVTGGSAGLGRHFAQLLAARGARVVVGARRREACEDVCSAIAAAGGQATPVRLDVTSEASVREALDEAAATYGTVEILINNAGVAPSGPIIDAAEADFDRTFDTNVKGNLLVAQAVARDLRAAGRGGAIVNVASILGLRVSGGVAAYAASKAALIQLTQAMALEWARHGIRVNALCPGYIETDLNRAFFASDAGQALIKRIPQRRLGLPGDLDGPMLLLCSDAGRFMTGAALAVDGGHLVSPL